MIFNIQALRALAAMLVVMVHLPPVIWPLHLDRNAFSFGDVGVDLFFVISGFVMVHTIRRRPLPAGAFLANRVIRVVPLYWLLTLGVFAVALVAPALLGSTKAAWPDLVRSLLFIPYEKEPGAALPVLFVGWTLNYEMFFYAIFALSLALGRRSLAATILGAIGVLLVLVGLGWAIAPKSVPLHFFTKPIMLEFGFGMLIAWAEPGKRALPVVPVALAGVVGLVVLVVGTILWPDAPRLLVTGLPAAAAVTAAAVLEERGALVLRGTLTQLMGAASYALYLTHPFVLQAVGKVSQRLHSVPLAYALLPVAILGALIVAVLVHKMLERPMTDRLRHLVHRPPPIVETAEPDLGAVLPDAR